MENVYIKRAENLYFNGTEECSYKVTIEEKYKNDFGAFTPIGVLKSSTTRISYMDLLDLIISLSKKEQELFNEIKNNSDRNLRIASMDHWENLDKSVQGILYQRLVTIKAVGLIRKIYPMAIPKEMHDSALTARIVNILTKPGKFSFIINPNYIKAFEVNSAKAIWNQLKN